MIAGDLRFRVLALAALLPAAVVLACGDQRPTAPPAEGAGVAAVEVSPDSAALHAIGAVQAFEAVARDSTGSPVPGVSVEWRGAETAVATVSTDGLATAGGEGTTVIEAVAGEVTGTAEFQVDASFSMAARVATVNESDPAAANDTAAASVTIHAR